MMSKSVALRRVVQIINGGTPTPEEDNWDGDIPWATPADLGPNNGFFLKHTGRYLTRKGADLASTIVPPGSVLLSTRAPIGYVAINTVSMAFNQGCKALIAQNNMSASFIRYALAHIEYELQTRGQGSTFLELSSAVLGSIKIPCPDLEVQINIEHFLDRETVQIDELIAKQERLIELLAEKRQAVITHAVTKGLDPTTPTKPSGIPWLGNVPSHWEVNPLKHLLAEPLQYGANESAEFNDPDWPRYLRITDFELNGALKNHTFRSLPPNIAAAYMVKSGDVLFARSGATVGKTFIVPEDSPKSCFAGYLIKAACAPDKLLPSFFVTYTKSSNFAEWKDASLTVATIQNISADKLANLAVPVPPLAEQQELMRQLHGRLSKLDIEPF